MSENRKAKNISYKLFLTSELPENKDITSPRSEIPEFQRNYVWKTAHIYELIDAIISNESGYYFGNIVLVKESNNGVGKIVDGQQRLITLSLILHKLNDYFIDDTKRSIDDLLWANFEEKEPRIKFLKPDLNKLYLQILKKEEINEDNLNHIQNILYKAYVSIGKKVGKINTAEKYIFLQKIISLEFVVIRTFSEDEAYLLFEGLNSTGLTLSATELTKNALLGKIKELKPTSLDEALMIWDNIENSFSNTNSNLGWFLKLIRHQWFSTEGYVTNSQLFKEIKVKIIQKEDASGLIEYLNILKNDAEKYQKLRKSSAEILRSDFSSRIGEKNYHKIRKILFETRKLGLDQIYSIFLALWKYGEYNTDYFKTGNTFKTHIEKLWGFVILIKFSDISPSKYERVFAELCHDIQELSYLDFKNKMQCFFKEKLLPIVSSFGKDEFAKRVSEEISTNSYDESFVKFLLSEYLASFGHGKDDEPTLEHIIPKKGHVNWPNINKTLNLKYIENIGNLTILNDALNKLAEDFSFDDKVITAYNESAFEKNKEIAVEYGDQFKSVNPIENAVLERGKDIGNALYDKYLEQLRNI